MQTQKTNRSLALAQACLVPLAVLFAATLFAASTVIARPAPASAASLAAPNTQCTLIVPQNPLTAQGLATPYQLTATNPQNGPCNEANPAQSAFVQSVVLDPGVGAVSVYEPLVIDQNSQPAAPNVVPTLPAGAVVGIWFGFNGTQLTLLSSNGNLQQGNCVNGLNGSIFGQVAFCNAQAFFAAANNAIAAGTLVPPPLGTAKDGMPCPTTRDFSVVDQDPSDNVQTQYLANGNGQTAQFSAANMAALQNQNEQILANGSDNRLLSDFIDKALGCTSWMAPDLANPGQMVPAQALNELQAAAEQTAPVAFIPKADPMVLLGGAPNLDKLNAYRLGVDQPTRAQLPRLHTFCLNLRAIAPARMLMDAQFTAGLPPPDPAAANSLLTFLAQRFVFTYEAPQGQGLNCKQVLDQPDPVAVTTDGNGVAVTATINGIQVTGTQGTTSSQATSSTPTPTGSPLSHPVVMPMTMAQYMALAMQDAQAAGIPPDLFIRQINQESGFNPAAISPKGALGIAQFLPSTAAGLGIDPWDPVASLKGAAGLMARYVQMFDGNYAMALAAYNGGTGTVQHAVSACGPNWQQCLPAETQHYIKVILGG